MNFHCTSVHYRIKMMRSTCFLKNAKREKLRNSFLNSRRDTIIEGNGSKKFHRKDRDFGAWSLFNCLLPLLMKPTLEVEERHILVEVLTRLLYQLNELVRPFAHKILIVVEPFLVDEDHNARLEGQDIVFSLSKVAGLDAMTYAMFPDIHNIDEYVRSTTSISCSIVASDLGISPLLPFLKQVLEVVSNGVSDEDEEVRIGTAVALAALSEASAPYGIESFESVLRLLWRDVVGSCRGKLLAAFLMAYCYLIPHMDAPYANYFTKEAMDVLIREFDSPDEEEKEIVLKAVNQCASLEDTEADYNNNLPEMFSKFLSLDPSS
ncbi:splicing factor [Actinidia rufa]|uniref:Splicing factor n=1 Tax=Actinidia rufa TaxID=165716 RepID=A0A7J0DKT7_9ERIC|nr:splicing factor [Actinidia rufa]